MNDLETLKQIWEEPAPPSTEVRARARHSLTEGRRHSGRRRGRYAVRIAVVVSTAVALVLGVTFLPDLPGINQPASEGPAVRRPLGPAATAAEALERAAAAAEDQPFVAPGSGQWIYLREELSIPSEGPGGYATGGPLKTVVNETWTRADGKRVAGYGEDGKLWVFLSSGGAHMGGDGFQYVYEEGKPDPLVDNQVMPESGFSPSDFSALASLPTDPKELRQWAVSNTGPMGVVPADDHDSFAYGRLITLMRSTILPPDLEAATFRALEGIPGVTLVGEAIDVAGRPAIGVGRIIEGWLHQEVLLDQETYEYLGERVVAVEDKEMVGLDGRGLVKKGTIQRLTARTGSGIVDHPGEVPS